MEDIINYYKLDMHTKFINELLIECMEILEGLKA